VKGTSSLWYREDYFLRYGDPITLQKDPLPYEIATPAENSGSQ